MPIKWWKTKKLARLASEGRGLMRRRAIRRTPKAPEEIRKTKRCKEVHHSCQTATTKPKSSPKLIRTNSKFTISIICFWSRWLIIRRLRRTCRQISSSLCSWGCQTSRWRMSSNSREKTTAKASSIFRWYSIEWETKSTALAKISSKKWLSWWIFETCSGIARSISRMMRRL